MKMMVDDALKPKDLKPSIASTSEIIDGEVGHDLSRQCPHITAPPGHALTPQISVASAIALQTIAKMAMNMHLILPNILHSTDPISSRPIYIQVYEKKSKMPN